METLNGFTKFIKYGTYCLPRSIFKYSKISASIKNYSKEEKGVQVVKKDFEKAKIEDYSVRIEREIEKKLIDMGLDNELLYKSKPWNEISAIKRAKRRKTWKILNEFSVDFLSALQKCNELPGNFTELGYYLRKREVRKQLIEQQYLPERHSILKPDLATAHFLVKRGGSIKFLGQKNWIGVKESHCSLPSSYVPGLYVEKIKAEGTGLYYEGLKNLCDLPYLNSLSLKGLQNLDDWCLDWVSSEHPNLVHLDISDCKNVTYRGLSCFYRFKQLKTLNVGGISDSPEFKVACLMLQDIKPDLEILGLDLSVPEKIVALEEISLSEQKNSSKEN